MSFQCLTLASGGLPRPHSSTATRPVRIPQQSVASIAGVGCHGTRNISTICLNNSTICRIGKARTHNPCTESAGETLIKMDHTVVFLLHPYRDLSIYTCVLEMNMPLATTSALLWQVGASPDHTPVLPHSLFAFPNSL